MSNPWQARRGTAAQWTSANSILSSGEMGFETDTGKIKIGDGTTVWTILAYIYSIGDTTVLPTADKVVRRDGAGKMFSVGVDLTQGELYNFKPRDITVAGTTYTLLSTDMGAIVHTTSGSAVAVTVPSGLPTGFHCTIIQEGAGQVTVTGSGATVFCRQGFTKTAGQNAAIALVAKLTANHYILQGDGA